MRLYAYVPADDRDYIRRVDVPPDDCMGLSNALVAVGLSTRPPHATLEADAALVALDWLEERAQLPADLAQRVRRETEVPRWLLYRSGKLPRELLVRKLSGWTWREAFRPYLRAVLWQIRGQHRPHQNQALRDAFPAGQRKFYPYKTWLDEIRVQRGLKSPPRRRQNRCRVRESHPRQVLMFGGAL